MDPLIAAQFYNNRFCPFSRLPEELLLRVLGFLADDPVTLHCLQAVSRIFLRLLDSESDIWRYEWYLYPSPASWRGAHTIFLESPFNGQVQSLLRRDGRCDNCRRWNDASVNERFNDCKFEQRRRRHDYRKLYCGACDTQHDICQFSKASRERWEYPQARRCLGQEGSVQLCEHVQITWASITAHIDDWRRRPQNRAAGDWEACLNSFNIECRDAGHDTRCTASEAPTWPRACLRTGFLRWSTVVLRLEWAPHSRIDSLALTADGQIPAHALRARFQRLRQLGPADTFYPASRPGALPELACISSACPFIYYKTGQDDETPPPIPSDGWQLSRYCRSLKSNDGSGESGRKLEIMPHLLKNAGDVDISCQCFVARYMEDIIICKNTAIMNPTTKLVPNDDWLHAMDTDTYPHPEAFQIRSQCRDEKCVNYYRRRKDCGSFSSRYSSGSFAGI